MIMRRLGEIIRCIVFKELLLQVVSRMDWQGVSGSKCTNKTIWRAWEDHLVGIEKVSKELGCKLAENNANF